MNRIDAEVQTMLREHLSLRSTAQKFNDILAHEGITDPDTQTSILGAVQTALSAAHAQAEMIGTGQAVGDAIFGAVCLGIRLAKKGLV